jgi:SNF family Na+-dependent transporter
MCYAYQLSVSFLAVLTAVSYISSYRTLAQKQLYVFVVGVITECIPLKSLPTCFNLGPVTNLERPQQSLVPKHLRKFGIVHE